MPAPTRIPPVHRPTPVTDLPLFGQTEAHARASDPETSKDSARKVSRSTLEAVVLGVIRARGPITSHEIADYLEVPLVAVSPRIAPLRRKGLVKGGAIRDGRTEWVAVDDAA